MTWTKETAYEFLQKVYTDEVMQQEKRRIFRLLNRQLYERLDDLAINQALSDKTEKQLYFFEQFTFMPGDNIFQSMRYLFLVARGEAGGDRGVTERHLDRVYKALYQPAGLKNPVIPDSFWETTLGIACKIAEDGIESVYPILDEMKEAEE